MFNNVNGRKKESRRNLLEYNKKIYKSYKRIFFLNTFIYNIFHMGRYKITKQVLFIKYMMNRYNNILPSTNTTTTTTTK